MNKHKIKSKDYINIQGWMLTELGLKGAELIIYAAIYGFSKSGQGIFTGSSSYLADWAGIQKRQCLNILKKLNEKKLIKKIEKTENGVRLIDYVAYDSYPSVEIASVVQKLHHPGAKITSPPGAKIAPHNIDTDNIEDNIIKKFSLFLDLVIDFFEPNIKKETQKKIWLKTNRLNLWQIFNFCDSDIETALQTINKCFNPLKKADMKYNYGTVIKSISSYYGEAISNIQNGKLIKYTKEMQDKINEVKND